MNRKIIITSLACAAVAVFGCRFALGGIDHSNAPQKVVSAQEAETSSDKADDRIAQNIFINGVDVSGMDKAEAKQALQSTMDKFMQADISLSTKEGGVHATATDLQVSTNEDDIIDKAIHYGKSGNLIERFKESQRMKNGEGENFAVSFSPAAHAVERFLESHQEELSREAQDNTVVRQDGKFVFQKGKSGFTVNIDDSVEAVREYFDEKWDGSDCSIDLALDEIKPRGEEEEFAKMTDVLGTYTTEYGSSPSGRKTNIINGSAKVNGSVLFPGDEISIAAKLAPITVENGYAEGTAYENGQVVPSIGGGVCQISSTLYNAAILAELDITERSEHSMTVSYVEPSRDAAIAGTVKDLKIKNNQKSPIYIDLATSDSAITATVFGEETRPANRKVDFEAEILSRTEPRTVYIADGSQPIGYKSGGGDAHTGYSAQLVKIVTVDGKEESREVFNTSHYSVKNVEYHIGTASPSAEGAAAMNAAVASQDIGTINAMISQWNASAIAARIEEAQAANGLEGGDGGDNGTAIVDDTLGGAVAQ